MALQSIVGVASLDQQASLQIIANDTGTLIDAAVEKVAMIFAVPKDGTITHVWIRTGNVSASQSLSVGLKSLDSNGDPTNTNYGGSSPGTIDTPAANTVYRVQLSQSASATAGDVIALVVEFTSTAGNLYIAANANQSKFPIIKQYTTSWAIISRPPLCAVEYSDGTCPPIGAWLVSEATTQSIHINSSPDEIALRFRLPFPARLVGVLAAFHTGNNVTATWRFQLYQGTTQLYQSRVWLANETRFWAGAIAGRFYFNGTVDLQANTDYYLSLLPTSTTPVYVQYVDVPTGYERLWDAWDGGREWYWAQRTDAGSWTENTVRRPAIYPILSAFDDGGSGVAGIVPALNRGVTR